MSGKIYEKASQEIQGLVAQVLQTYHSEFWDLDVKVVATMVSKMGPEDELVPCLKLHGNAAFAIIHVVRAAQRIHVEHDAEIFIDAYRWNNASEALRHAIIDHELEHLVLAKDRRGSIKTDDRGRPKIRLKPDDYALTGFYIIVERHGVNSAEYASLDHVTARVGQALEVHNTRSVETPPPNATATLPPPVVAAP